MPLQIPNHAHCLVCGRAIVYGEKSCSKACQTKVEEQEAKRKKQLLILYGLMAIAFAVAVAPLFMQ